VDPFIGRPKPGGRSRAAVLGQLPGGERGDRSTSSSRITAGWTDRPTYWATG